MLQNQEMLSQTAAKTIISFHLNAGRQIVRLQNERNRRSIFIENGVSKNQARVIR